MLKLYIAPSKLYLKTYPIEDSLFFIKKRPFEQAAEAALSEECERLYGKKRIKLTGYSYEQYNENGWSYYPVQFSVNSKYQGISWIKWKYEDKDEYFDLLHTSISMYYPMVLDDEVRRQLSDTLPQIFRFCTDEEVQMLSQKHKQPNLKYDILAQKQIKVFPASMNSHHDKLFFIYEFRRQMTPMLTNLTGINDLYKIIVQVNFSDLFTENIDGYTYVDATITINPINPWEIYPQYRFIIRWKSNTDKEYIGIKNVIGSDDISFEFSPIIPKGFKGVSGAGGYSEKDIISKDALLEFINKYDKKNKKPIDTGTSFPVFLNSVSYPSVILKIQFESEFSDQSLEKMLYAVNDFIQSHNSKSEEKIHDFNVKRKSENIIWLYIDFGSADPIAVQHFFEYIDGKYEIKRIDMG